MVIGADCIGSFNPTTIRSRSRQRLKLCFYESLNKYQKRRSGKSRKNRQYNDKKEKEMAKIQSMTHKTMHKDYSILNIEQHRTSIKKLE